MYESSKAPFARQGRFVDLDNQIQPVRPREVDVTQSSLRLDLGRMANRTAMENFGLAIAELLDCKKCYVATMFPNATSGFNEVRIGYGKGDPSCDATVAYIARQETSADCTLVEHFNARTTFVRKLIGAQTEGKEHSVIGRMSIAEGATVVFVAGWRSTALPSAEIPCVVRAIRMMWATTQAAAGRPLLPRPDHRIWLDDLSYPAIVVDEGLSIHETNGPGRALLAKGEFLKADHGTLSGLDSSVTENLKRALADVLSSRSGQRCSNTTIPLSIDSQRFAFARLGAVPGESGKVLMIVPQFDEASGASRIAAAFGLNWAEERIVTRILQGQRSRTIGEELNLTEATVRTYTKRIMLKLGINRQSEFFLLYHLTSSPFGAAARSNAHVHQGCLPDRNERAH